MLLANIGHFLKALKKGTGTERPGHPEQGLTAANHM